jgi:hypothetical protein
MTPINATLRSTQGAEYIDRDTSRREPRLPEASSRNTELSPACLVWTNDNGPAISPKFQGNDGMQREQSNKTVKSVHDHDTQNAKNQDSRSNAMPVPMSGGQRWREFYDKSSSGCPIDVSDSGCGMQSTPRGPMKWVSRRSWKSEVPEVNGYLVQCNEQTCGVYGMENVE